MIGLRDMRACKVVPIHEGSSEVALKTEDVLRGGRRREGKRDRQKRQAEETETKDRRDRQKVQTQDKQYSRKKRTRVSCLPCGYGIMRRLQNAR